MRKIIPVIFLLFLLNSSINAQVTFNAPSEMMPCDTSSYCINIEVVNFDSVIGFQYSYGWDPSIMTLDSYNHFLGSSFVPNESEVANGQFGVSWSEQLFQPVSLADNTPIMELCFSPIAAGTSPILFDLPLLPGAPIEVFGIDNGNFGNLPYQLNDGSIVVEGNNGPPIITCPSDVVVMSAPTTVDNIEWLTLTDCDLDSVAYFLSGSTTANGSGDASGSFFNADTTLVTYIAADLAGNTQGCSFNVILEAPTSTNDSLLEILPQVTIDCDNDQVIMDFLVVNFDEMVSNQYLLNWDTTSFAYNSHVSSLANQTLNTIAASDGFIFVSWSHQVTPPPNPILSTTLPDSTIIFTLTFDLVGTPTMPFVNYLPPTQFVDVNGQMDSMTNYILQPGYVVNTIDNTPPTIANCPTDTTVYVSSAMCVAAVNYMMPTVTDACDPNPSLSCSPGPGLFLPLGINPVTCTATDASGNTSNCMFNVTVLDTIPPMITCPNDTLVNTDPDKCSALVDGLAPVSISDNCTASPQIEWIVQPQGTNGFFDVSSSVSMVTFMLGTNTVTYSATDDSGVTGSCEFTVTVEDLDPPTISCIADTTFNTGSASCNVAAFIPAPAVDDNCGLDSLTYTINGITTTLALTATEFVHNFPVGTTTVTYTVVDAGGLSASCSFDVTINDDGAPTLDCPATVNVNPDPGACDASATVPAPTFSDNCGIDSLTYTVEGVTTTLPLGNTSFTGTFDLGTTTVTYNIYDQNGNAASCTVDVIVTDNTAPTLTCPTDTTLTLMTGNSVTVGDIAAVASDACGTVNLSYALSGATTTPGPSSTDASGTDFNTGTTTVTYYANDGNGNLDSCSFFVNVTGGQLDVDCQPDQVGFSDPLACGQILFGLEPIINSEISNINSITYTLSGATMGGDTLIASGTFFNVGETTVTYFISDIFGNMLQCSFLVTITDTTPPQIVCPTVDAFPSDAGQCFATIPSMFLAPPVSGMFDNCGIDSVGFTLTGANNASGPLTNLPTIFDIGTSQLTYTIIDVNGLSTSCSIEVVVNDSEAPIIDCPTDTLILVPSGTTDTMVNDLGITYSDLCGSVNSVLFTTTSGVSDTLDASGTSFPVGSTTVTYNVTDEAGNLTTCTFIVAVVEDTAPDCIDCPEDVIACSSSVTGIGATIVCDPNDLQSLTWSTTGASGMQTGIGDISSDMSGFVFAPGTTFVTYTAVDNNNFVDECTFIVQVDDIAPTITNCPVVPLVVNAVADQCKATVDWQEPMAADLCGIESFTSNTIPLETFPLGDTTVTYVAVDSAGNMATCSFVISVLDVTGPVFDFCPPNNIVYSPQPGTCDAIVTWDEPIAVDVCSNVTVSSSHTSGSLFTGTTTVVYVATDDAGNSTTCSFDIIADDNSNPVIENCPTDTILTADANLCAAIYEFIPPTATDDCSAVSITCTAVSGDTFNIGVTSVVCIAIDAAGNDTTCTFDVTVMDAGNPIFDFCPDNILVLSTDMGECGATVFWPSPTASDDCDTSILLTSNFESGDFFPVGDTTVVYTATDDSGNTSTCEFVVTVEDNEVPIIDCGGNIVVDLAGNVIEPGGGVIDLIATDDCDSISIFFMAPVVTENCPGFTVTHDGPSSGMAFPLGITILTYTVTDMSGNASTCQLNVEVLPLPEITIDAVPGTEVCAGTNVQLNIESTAAEYEWFGPGGWTSPEEDPVIPQVSGNYLVVCTPATGCTTTGNVDILYNPSPIFEAWSNSPICNENIELNLTIDPSSPPVDSFFWEFPDGTISTVEDPIIGDPDQSDGGIYTITLYSGLCSVSEDITVEVIGNFTTPELFTDCDGAVCLGETCTIIGTSYPEGVFYNWTATPADCLPAVTTGNTIEVTPNAVGNCVFTYWVVQDGCVSDTVSIALSVSDGPTAVDDVVDAQVGEAQTFDILANDDYNTALGGNVTIMTEIDPLQGVLVANEDGTYTFTPADGFAGTVQFVYQICHNCDQTLCETAIVSINVIDDSCTVPNIITPNGDGMNEELRINCLNSGLFQESTLQILNEWGDEVYFAKPYNNDWRGTWEGKDLPDGTYFYIFQLEPNSDIDKGYITIFR